MIGHDKRHALKVLGIVPVLVLTGDRDRVVDPACSDEIASAIRDAELVRIHGAGHAVILERPEDINEAIAGLAARALAHEAERRELTRKQSHVRRRDTGRPVTGGHAHDKKDSARRAAGWAAALHDLSPRRAGCTRVRAGRARPAETALARYAAQRAAAQEPWRHVRHVMPRFAAVPLRMM